MDAESSASKCPVFKIEQVETSSKPRRMQWSKTFDDWLACLVSTNKGRNWGDIAKAMCHRFPEVKFTSKKCRARWKNCINPEINKVYLNDAEELLLIAYHSTYKNKWSKISKHLPRRHSNILRNSFYGAMRKLIQQIVLGKRVSEDVSPLMFLQSLYISIFIIELLNLPQVPEHKNPLVPLYIYMYVKEKKIDKAMCEKYILQMKGRLLASSRPRSNLTILAEYTYDQLVMSFFGKLVAVIKQSVNSQSAISDDFLLDMFERALLLGSPFTVPLSSPTLPTPSCHMVQKPQPVCMVVGNHFLPQSPVPATFVPMPFLQMLSPLPFAQCGLGPLNLVHQ